MTLQTGAFITPKVRLAHPLGEGGMGAVWVADHLTLERQVAVKLIRGIEPSEEARSRFEREAKAAARISSPHVVQIFDYGITGDEQPYIIMELLQGEDLEALLRREKRLEIQRLKVAETPVERAEALWRRLNVFARSSDPKTRPEWSSFLDALRPIRGDASPTSIMLRAWREVVDGDFDEGMRMYGEALTLDTLRAELLVRVLWGFATDAVKKSWLKRQRAELVRSVWRSPAGWEWTHPFVDRYRAEYPAHFGGPRPDADPVALRKLVRRWVMEIATPDSSNCDSFTSSAS